jgi:hypothetical protein
MRSLPTAYRSLMDVKRDILGGSCSHHMSLITHIIRYYCNSPVEYDVSYVEDKYNKKGLTVAFTKVTSFSIHHLSLYKIYKSCRMAIVHAMGYIQWLEAIKLAASLTYPLKITKGLPISHPNTPPNLHLITIRNSVGLNNGCVGAGGT